jgi:hypothetical protein
MNWLTMPGTFQVGIEPAPAKPRSALPYCRLPGTATGAPTRLMLPSGWRLSLAAVRVVDAEVEAREHLFQFAAGAHVGGQLSALQFVFDARHLAVAGAVDGVATYRLAGLL